MRLSQANFLHAPTPDSTQPTPLMQLAMFAGSARQQPARDPSSQCFLTDQVFSGPVELLQSIRCRNSSPNPDTSFPTCSRTSRLSITRVWRLPTMTPEAGPLGAQ